MEESGFIRLVHDEANSTSERASIRRPWRMLGAAALLSVLFVAMVALGREAFRNGISSLSENYASRAAVPVARNETFDAYSDTAPKSCAGQPDGLEWIKPDGDRAIQVFCEGGWVLMQKRSGPSVNFYRDWISYRKGFGDETNFWLGNDNLHALTLSGARLRVVLVDANNSTRYAEYSTFSVADEVENFRVIFEEYSGNAGDALSYHSGMSFSTWDADHDQESGNCAESYFGAWWYKGCHEANLNGLYEGPGHVDSYATGITWTPWEGLYYSLRSCHMWVQPNM